VANPTQLNNSISRTMPTPQWFLITQRKEGKKRYQQTSTRTNLKDLPEKPKPKFGNNYQPTPLHLYTLHLQDQLMPLSTVPYITAGLDALLKWQHLKRSMKRYIHQNMQFTVEVLEALVGHTVLITLHSIP
jgi:hypothetical protein